MCDDLCVEKPTGRTGMVQLNVPAAAEDISSPRGNAPFKMHRKTALGKQYTEARSRFFVGMILSGFLVSVYIVSTTVETVE